MKLKKIILQNFRSYVRQEFDFKTGITLILGPNASGKTNLLESIYLLAIGKSFRADLEKEMIKEKEIFAKVLGEIVNKEGKQTLEVVLANQKRFFINGVGKRMMDFVGQLLVVYFGPEDLEIIINSPAIRRDYLDAVLEPVDRDYRRASFSYKKGLRQRNKLLETIREEGKPRSILYFWDKLLLENGAIITQKREQLIDFINQQPHYFGQLQVQYDKSIISPQRLEQYRQEEVEAGMTLVGPHRDDFIISIKYKESSIKSLHRYGSRGEQRTAVFSLKLAEMDFVNQRTGEQPILLLDDIFSELDHKHRKRLSEVIPKQQTIITTTDLHLVEPEARKKMEIINLRFTA